jgi:hypothetical protein
VDRLDTWLSAQRGWRLLLVRCVAFASFGLIVGTGWSVWVTFDPSTPQVRALITRMALCAAAGFLLTALTLVPRSGRGPARRPDRPWLTWRRIAANYSGCGACFAFAYVNAEPLAWQQHNGRVSLLPLALIGAAVVMSLWDARYRRRLRRPRDHGASPSTWA